MKKTSSKTTKTGAGTSGAKKTESRLAAEKAGKRPVKNPPAKPSMKKTKSSAVKTKPAKSPSEKSAPAPTKKSAKKAPRGGVSPAIQKKLLEILLQKRAVLEGDVSSLAEGAFKPSSLNVSVDHMADFGTDNFDQEFNLSLVESTELTLSEINEAITRITEGGFGICQECGCAIPTTRLEVIPYTRFCVQCQSEREKF